MAARLPVVGSDSGTWGTILNSFLSVSLASDGTILPAAISNKESTANKGVASGYAGLDGSSKVSIANLPTGTSSTTVVIGNDSRVTGAIQSSTATTKGDILAASAASTVTRLGVGANNTVLMADSTQATGIKWSSGVVLDGDLMFNVKDYGALGNGVANDATAIQSALDAIAALTYPGAVLFFPPGAYMIGAELEIKSAIYIKLARNAILYRNVTTVKYLFKNFNSSYAPTAYGGRHEITIEGGIMDMGGEIYTGSCTAFAFAQCFDVLIKDVVIRNIRDLHAILLCAVEHAVVRDCMFEGFNPIAASSAKIEAIGIEPAVSGAITGIGSGALDNTVCLDILVEGCTVKPNFRNTLDSYGGLVGARSFVDDAPSKDIRVIGNYIEATNDYGVHAYNWEEVVVANNNFYNCNGGVQIEIPSTVSTQADLNFITIQGNIFRSTGVQNNGAAIADAVLAVYGLDATTSVPIREANVTGNTIKGFDNGSGIIFNNVADVICANNVVVAIVSAAQVGIRSEGSYGATITGNKLSGGMSTASIWVLDGGASTVSDATVIANNNLNGVGSLYTQSDFCSVSGNVISTPTGTAYGILISGANNSVTGNVIRKSTGTGSGSYAAIAMTVGTVYIQANTIQGYGPTDATGSTNWVAIRRNGQTLSPSMTVGGNSTVNLNRIA